jgi:acyl-homoserine-lactone acylase
VFGDIGTERGPRTRLGLDMIAQRLAGTDGLGPPGFTLPALEATMLGNRNYSAELGRADVVAMCRAHPVMTAGDGKRVDVRAACDTLAGWDGRADAGSRGERLWEMFFDDSLWAVPFDPAHPLTTPRGIDGNDPDVQRAFADAVRFGESDRDIGRARRWAGITLHGCPDEKGCFNVIEADGRSIQGSSFIMAVELTPHGPRTRTILTFSQSANPTSPHHRDQTVLFSDKQWVTERFSEAEINADPHLKATTLHD